jgi:uncharacterized protein YcbK (DUF882 family)
MHRRTLLLGFAAPALIATVEPAHAAAGRRLAPGRRRLAIRHAATGARFAGPYHDGRAVDLVALADISAVLADSRTGTIHPFDPAALDFLWETGQRAGIRGEFLIASGFRTRATNTAVHGAGDSQHLRAAAVDVCLPSAQLSGFGATALQMQRGGVGVYTSQSFVHLDSGPVRRWGDVPGGRGAPARQDPLARMAEAWAATRQN